MTSDFTTRLLRVQQDRDSLLCVGIDPDPSRIPDHLRRVNTLADAVLGFNRAIIEATSPFACAFKLNFAFFEALGPEGGDVLAETIKFAGASHLVIADAKRGDIGNSARFYAQSVFDQLGCDACTVAPYMGEDSVTPFLEFEDRATFVLIRTSNPSSSQIQELCVDGTPVYETTAALARTWARDRPGRLGFVVGATHPEPVRRIRQSHPDVPLLIPGVGTQGGDVMSLIQSLQGGTGPVLINSSRQILYASTARDFAEAAARAAGAMREQLRASSVELQ